MASSELTPSKSTQDLIQASRPGFPKGLRVRRRRPARIPLGRGGDAERDTDRKARSVLHLGEARETVRAIVSFPTRDRARRRTPG